MMITQVIKVHVLVTVILLAPTSLSVCKFSLHYPHRISGSVMRIKQMIIHSNLSKVKNKTLPICLQGEYNYRDSLEEFNNASYDTCFEMRG